MNSLRRWLYRPKRSDSSLLAQFYFADEDLNLVAAELDSFEGRKDPERCTSLVNQLRACQARVLNVVSQMMDEQVKDFRASRDFRVKFPDDVIQENLAGQLWFGAECLAAGSSIMNREVESACMRPLARALTKNLDSLRNILREQCLRNVQEYTEVIKESLIIFDKLFAEFELSYVSAMVPVKTAHEYDLVQEITVLFSETVQRALKIGLLTRDMIDEYDPALMFTIPRLAIVSGVHIFKDGPLNPDNDPWNLSEMFRPFQTLLLKIRELLGILTDEELTTLERALCSQEEPSFLISLEEKKKQNAREERRKSREERNPNSLESMKKKDKEESDDGSMENEMTALEIAEKLEALALNFEASRNTRSAQSNEHSYHEIHKKSNDTSSTSSSSFLSEAEDGQSIDAERNNGPDNFTNQLYYEANLDSHSLTHAVPVVEHHSAFPSALDEPPMHNLTNGDVAENDTSDIKQFSNKSAEDHNATDANTEAAAVGRAHFAMNKCDSNDSGLHSEVLSNSGSTFTISSSDSNQHVAISDVNGTTDYHGCQNSLHLDDQTAENHLRGDVVENTPNFGSGKSAHSDNKDSMDILMSGTEVNNRNIDLCLSSSGYREDAGVSNSELDHVVLPANESQKIMSADDTAEHPYIIARHTTVPPNLPCNNSLNTTDTTPQALTENTSDTTSQPLKETSESLSEVLSGNNINNVFGPISVQPGLNHSYVLVENSESENSESSQNVQEHICDITSPEQGGVCNGNTGEVREEDIILEQASSYDFTSTSLSAHPPVPPPAVSEDKQNNNEVKCAIVNEKTDVVNYDNKETVHSGIMQVDGIGGTFQVGEIEGQTGSSLETSPVVLLHASPISTTTTETSASRSPATSEPSCPSSAATNVSQDSGNLTLNPPSPSSQNDTQSHMSTTNTSNPSTSKSSTKIYYNGVKVSSKAKNIKKSSKIKRRQQITSSSHGGQKSGLPSQAKALMESQLLDSECNHSSETSSYTSDCGDQEEIDLAIKAAENVTRQQVRARFQNSSDMIHRLFVCISGVADQLQTNFAGDLRNILRAVFDMNCSEPVDISTEDKCKDTTPLEAAYRAMSHASRTARRSRNSAHQRQEPPSWVPDEQSNECMSCQVPFTFVRRRHHCRNCGKIFCSRCSSNFVPLPHFGQEKAVRVCNRCFMFSVTPFTVRPNSH